MFGGERERKREKERGGDGGSMLSFGGPTRNSKPKGLGSHHVLAHIHIPQNTRGLSFAPTLHMTISLSPLSS